MEHSQTAFPGYVTQQALRNQTVNIFGPNDFIIYTKLYNISEKRIIELIGFVNQFSEKGLIDHCQYLFNKEKEKCGKNLRYAIYINDAIGALSVGTMGVALAVYNEMHNTQGTTLNARFIMIAAASAFFITETLKAVANFFKPTVEERKSDEVAVVSKLINLATKGDLAGYGNVGPARKIGFILPGHNQFIIPLPEQLMSPQSERQITGDILIQGNTVTVPERENLISASTHPQGYGSMGTSATTRPHIPE